MCTFVNSLTNINISICNLPKNKIKTDRSIFFFLKSCLTSCYAYNYLFNTVDIFLGYLGSCPPSFGLRSPTTTSATTRTSAYIAAGVRYHTRGISIHVSQLQLRYLDLLVLPNAYYSYLCHVPSLLKINLLKKFFR